MVSDRKKEICILKFHTVRNTIVTKNDNIKAKKMKNDNDNIKAKKMKNDNRMKCGPKSIPAIRVIRLKSNNGAPFSTNVLTFQGEDTVHRFQ